MFIFEEEKKQAIYVHGYGPGGIGGRLSVVFPLLSGTVHESLLEGFDGQ